MPSDTACGGERTGRSTVLAEDAPVAADVVDELHAMWMSAASRLPREAASRDAIVVELVGPAGSGKTTLRRAMAAAIPGVRSGVRIARTQDTITTLGELAAQLPMAIGPARQRGVAAAWREGVQLARLQALHRSVMRARAGRDTLVILDEGPVFALAKLYVAWGGLSCDARGAARWHAAVERWRSAIDMVVAVDAPDAVLAERIRRRAKPHRIKDAAPEDAAAFLARYRAAYCVVLDQLCAGEGPDVLTIDGSAPVHATVPALARTILSGRARRTAALRDARRTG